MEKAIEIEVANCFIPIWTGFASVPIMIYQFEYFIKALIKFYNVKSQTAPAGQLEISRARVNQILNLLKLDKKVIEEIESRGELLSSKDFTARKLRSIRNSKVHS